MNIRAIKKLEIINSLSSAPEASLDKIKEYIDSLIAESNIPTRHNRSLKGIWKDVGFNKIHDLEGELREVRQELEDSILKRKF